VVESVCQAMPNHRLIAGDARNTSVRSSFRHPNTRPCLYSGEQRRNNCFTCIHLQCLYLGEGEALEESWVRRGGEGEGEALEEDSKGVVPISPLWAMLYHVFC